MIEELLSPANFELSLHAVQSSFAAIFLLIFSAYLLFQNKKSLTNIAFSNVSVAAAIWLSGTSFASIIIDQSLAFSVYRYYTFLGIALIAPGIYFLTVNTLKLDGKKNFVIAYYLIALIFYVVNLSGDWFAIGMEEKAWGNYVQYGPNSLIFLAFFFIIMLQSFYHYYSYLKKDLPSSERDRVKLHFISLLIAYIGAVDFLPTFGIDIYPIGFAPVFIFIFIQFYAILKYKLIITVNETFDNLKDGIITVDKNGKIKDINRSAKMMFETESTHAKRIDEVFPNLSGYLERLKDPSCDIIDEEIPFDLMNPNVGDRTLHLTISSIRNDFSGNMGMVIVLSDITERKRSDIAIRESEEKYRNLIERANEGVIIIQDGVIKFANEKTMEISGYKRDELVGIDFVSILPNTSKQDLVKIYLDRLAGKDVPKQYEIDFLKRDGNTIVIEVNAGIIEYEGKPADFVYLNDITERKGVEEKIRRSEETNRLLFENAVDPMLLIDEKARLVRVNKKIEEILGYKREDFIGKNIFSIGLIEKSSLKVIMKNLQRRAKGEDVPPYDVELISSDGDVKTFELNASRLEKGNKRANIMVILRDKTERNKIQSELRESEARYRNVLENMDYGYYEVDTKGDLTFFNNSLCKILGYTRAELVGMNNRKYMEPDVARSVFNKFNQIYNTGKTEKSFSYKVIRKDGEVRSVEASISCMENATGNKVGFRGIVRDITEKIRFEEEFAEFSRINNLIFENAVDPMIVIDRKGKIIRMNRKIETDLGYTKDDYLGKNIFKIGLIAQDSIITAIAQLQRRLRGEESKPYDVNLVHREGGVIPYELNASWFEEDGKLIGDIIIMRDISERKEAEEALKIEQGKYKNVVENIGEGIIVANDRGYITFTNSETEKILRYEIDGLIGKHINEVSSDSTKKMILPLMNNVLKGNNIHDFEMELLRKDGSPLIVELTISPRLEDGKITEMMGIIRDITEKKHAEEMIDLERMKYKNVVENIGDGLFVSDENGSITYADRKSVV